MSRSIASLFVSLGANISNYEKNLNKAQKKAMKFSREIGKAGDFMVKNFTLPILAVGAASVKAFADFEQAMVNSTAIMGNLSDDMRNKMETAARDVAKTTKFSAVQAAESYYFLASAGLDAAQSIEALPRVAAFAQAGNFDMARATDLLTDAQSALGLTVDDTAQNMINMTRVSDALTKAQVLANATTEQFSESLTNKAGAALRGLSKDVEEGLAVLAVFADQGLKGAAAGNALYIVLRDLQRASIKNQKEFKQYGVEVFDASGNINNMANIIGDLEKALDGMSDKQRRSTLMMMGFQDESLANIQALLGTSDAIRTYEQDLRNAGGTTQEVADKQMKGLWAQLGLLKDRLMDTNITLGKSLSPTITGIVIPAADGLIQRIEEIAETFAALEPEQQKSILKNIALVASIGIVLKILSGLAFAITTIIGLFKTLGGYKVIGFVIAGLKGVVLAIAAFTGGPIWVVVAAVTALVTATGLLIKNWDKLKPMGLGNFPAGAGGPNSSGGSSIDRFSQSTPTSGSVNLGGGYIEAFDKGGIVPGPRGAPRMILAHGGETILPTHKSGGTTTHHTFDPIRIEGVNNAGELVAAAEVVLEALDNDRVQRKMNIVYEKQRRASVRGLGLA